MRSEITLDSSSESWTLGSVMAHARRRLVASGIEAADREARWLIEDALGLTGSRLLLDSARLLTGPEMAKVDAYVSRRAAREPLQYILGIQEFCGLEFEVNPAVLIPRPETELLLQEVIRRLPRGERATVVDVGTGSGCLAVTVARALPNVRVLATDLSGQALVTAKRNARRHGVEQAIHWLEGDLLAPLSAEGCEGTVTAILANPPYIREAEWGGLQPEVGLYEPRMALVAGARGTELHERLLAEAVSCLRPGGLLAMELGQGQSAEIRAKIEAMPAYGRAEILPDEAGIDRIVIVERVG
ncbi:MAG TPA: peptide chain release factor N(5)-glutamine methyltransferase [Nitrospira sp.]|nr:peptide chain release factor N(5)-glutamine methyltransferase [Nitrospira sp.]